MAILGKEFNKIQINTSGAAIFMEHGGSGSPLLFYMATRRRMPCGARLHRNWRMSFASFVQTCVDMAIVPNRKAPRIMLPIPSGRWLGTWWK